MTEDETFRRLARVPFSQVERRPGESWREAIIRSGWTIAEWDEMPTVKEFRALGINMDSYYDSSRRGR